MNNSEIAKLVYQEILIALQNATEEWQVQFHMPAFIRIGDEAYFYDVLYREEMKQGFAVSENLK
jgi:hypothetical protein